MDSNTQEPMILHGFRLTAGKGEAEAAEEIAESVRSQEHLSWVHLNANHPDTRDWLQSNINYLDSLILDALLAEETRPRILEFEAGVLMILRGVNLNENASPEDMVSIRLWIDPFRIVSLRRRRVKAVQDIKSSLENGKGPKTAGEFLVRLATRLFERMEPVIQEMDESSDEIEERVMEQPDAGDRRDIIGLRKKAILLRRYIAPQKDVISQLKVSDQDWLNNMNRRQLQEIQDRLTRYVEDLDTIRERGQIIKDELANALSDRLNRNLYLLSVIAAVFLPLGFLTGLLGINVGGMPGADNDTAFWWVSGGLAAIVTAQVTLFKKLKWF